MLVGIYFDSWFWIVEFPDPLVSHFLLGGKEGQREHAEEKIPQG